VLSGFYRGQQVEHERGLVTVRGYFTGDRRYDTRPERGYVVELVSDGSRFVALERALRLPEKPK
jgi:hypothetical protein